MEEKAILEACPCVVSPLEKRYKRKRNENNQAKF